MRLTNNVQITDFLAAITEAKDNVYLRSTQGDCYNLKSTLARYVAIAELLSEHGDELELFCDDKTDEALFFRFFNQHPEVL